MRDCRWRSAAPVAIIYFGLFFDFFLLEGFVIVHPTLSQLHGMADSALTPMLSLCKFTMMLMCPVVALVSTRLAAHKILIIGIGCLSMSALCLSFSHSPTMFGISKIAHGVASPSLTLSSMSILASLSETSTRGRYASFAYTAVSHGLLTAPFVTGVMVVRLGQFWAYLILCCLITMNLIAAIVYFFELPSPLSCTIKSVVKVESTMSVTEPNSSHKDIRLFKRISRRELRTVLVTLLTSPRMLTAIASCFLVGLSIGSNESVLPVILSRSKKTLGLSDMSVDLIWTAGSIAYTVLAGLTGFFADRIPPVRLMLAGMTAFILTYSTMPQVCSSLAGLITHITLTGALTSFLDVSAYPLVASVVDTANIPNAYIIGFSIEYCIEQAGYAIGQYAGTPLYELTDSLEPVAYLVAGVDTLLLVFSICVLSIYPSNRWVVPKVTGDWEEVCVDQSIASTSSTSEVFVQLS